MRPSVRRITLCSLLATAACGSSGAASTTTLAPLTDGGTTALPPVDAAASPLPPLPIANSGVLVAGKARFTVITPTLIRIEYDEAKTFVDDSTYFAANRSQR